MIDAQTLPRLLLGAGGRPLTLEQHEKAFAMNARPGSVLEHLEASGLRGRGGASFPTFQKVALLRAQRSHSKFVVVNAMEGEPAAHKDQTLLSTNPHLVLDGAEFLAAAIGANKIAVCVSRDNPAVVHHVERAIHERTRRSLRGPKLELHAPPWRYVAGEESGLVHWLDDNESLPQYRPGRPHILKIGHAPVLVDNAETCANVGLIGRFGAEWFRSLGTHAMPGSTLISLSGAVRHPTVLEVPLGTSLRSILGAGGADPDPQAVLIGGYGGTWLGSEHLDVGFANESLAPLGATVGAGILVVLPRSACGLVETHRIARWMANESARQCGPCAFGLPALADDLAQLSLGSRDPEGTFGRLVERCGVIEGRGACRHPDGVTRLIKSALEVFASDVHDHMRARPCAGAESRKHYVPMTAMEREDEMVWE